MAENNRKYLFSEAQTRMMFVVSGIGMVATVIAILIMATSQPQGRFSQLDRTAYLTTLERSTENLSGYSMNPDGSATIPLEHAMQLVVERGVQDTFASTALSGDAVPDSVVMAVTDLPDGEVVYTTHCAACHQVNGQGIPGAFPPQAGGHTPKLYVADRDYLIKLVLYGLQGQIEVQEQVYNGVMPGMAYLGDGDIAAVLNFSISAWDNEEPEGFESYTAEDVAALRATPLSPAAVYEIRQGLGLD